MSHFSWPLTMRRGWLHLEIQHKTPQQWIYFTICILDEKERVNISYCYLLFTYQWRYSIELSLLHAFRFWIFTTYTHSLWFKRQKSINDNAHATYSVGRAIKFTGFLLGREIEGSWFASRAAVPIFVFLFKYWWAVWNTYWCINFRSKSRLFVYSVFPDDVFITFRDKPHARIFKQI